MSGFGTWIIGALSLLASAAAIWWRGRASARREATAKQEADYVQTRRRMDAADDHGNDPDAARRWLRERDAAQP